MQSGPWSGYRGPFQEGMRIDAMFREMAMTTLAATAIGILLHALVTRHRGHTAGGQSKTSPLAGLVRAGAGLAVFICMLGLVISGFYPRLALDVAPSGRWLMIHVALGGAFVAALAVLAVVWAWDHWDLTGRWGRKAAFWLMLTAAIPMALAVLLNMCPVFGTSWQGGLLEIHRYSALVCVICGAIWGYLTLRGP